jgi:gliding motility-associated-like protein
MMKKYDDVGKLYKDMFSDYTPEPPAQVWNNIQAIKRKRSSLWKKIIFSGAGIIIVGAVAYWIAVNSQLEKTAVAVTENKTAVETKIDHENPNPENGYDISNGETAVAFQSVPANNVSETEMQTVEPIQNINHSLQNSPSKTQSGTTPVPSAAVHRKDTSLAVAASAVNSVSEQGTERLQNEIQSKKTLPLRISKDTAICENGSLQLYAYNVGNVRWNTGETQNCITIYPAGTEQYSVTFAVENGKDSTVYITVKTVECTEIHVPNIFTPNGDGLNDLFLVKTNMELTFFEITVYAANGKQLLFTSQNINRGWDGTYRGQLQPQGLYYYHIRYIDNFGKHAEKRGELLLILQ